MIQKYGNIETVFKVAEAGELVIPRLTGKVKAALASKEGQDMVRGNMEMVNLLYTPEVENEIFAPWKDMLDTTISRFAEPPVLNMELIKEKMFEDGRVNLYHDCDNWVKTFHGYNNICPF
jgi:hypothetical protein